MFTGLVTAVGTVRAARRSKRGLELTIAAPYRGLKVGESVAVDGACLTVVGAGRGSFRAQAVAATRGRTNFGDYRRGRLVNLERALRLGDRLGGHLVSGHVDGVGTVIARRALEDSVLLDIRVPGAVAELLVPHGSITVNGVSLTVNRLPRRRLAQVSLVPHTLRATTLGRVRVGSRVHLEADLIGKLVKQLLAPYRAASATEA